MKRGFTLLELLIVVGILALLGAMLMPLLGTAMRSARRINTESVLRTVHAAARMFRQDVGVLPWQSYPDADITPDNPARNGLARRLGHALDATERSKLNSAVSAAAGKYAYRCNLDAETEGASQPSTLTYLTSRVQPLADAGLLVGWYNADRWNSVELAYVVNRLATQRARAAVQAGVLDLPGPLIAKPGGAAPVADLTGTPLLAPAERDAAVVGWCDDYLDGALEKSRIAGDDVLDAWGRPIIMIGQCLPRIQFSNVQIGWGSIGGLDTSWFGLGQVGFRPGTGPWNGIVAAQRWRLLALGRIRLATGDAGDGQPTPADAAYLPDAGVLAGSDRRYYAAPGFENDCELWSAGQEGIFAWRRDDPRNQRAIPFQAIYDRNLR